MANSDRETTITRKAAGAEREYALLTCRQRTFGVAIHSLPLSIACQ